MKLMRKMTALLAAGTMLFTWSIGMLPESVREMLEIEVRAAGDVVASGECGAEGDNLIWTLDDEGMLIISGEGEMRDWDWSAINLWAEYDIKNVCINEGVTSIGMRAFYSCEELISVIIPQSVTSIGENAFAWSGLTSVTIPATVSNIGGSAFSGTTWLTNKQEDGSLVIINDILIDGTSCKGNVIIPDSVVLISDGAFTDCIDLTSIVIPNTISCISKGMFSGCTNLSSVSIPDSVTHIKPEAFYDCVSLKQLNLPDSISYIDKGAFGGCEGITSIELPSNLKSLGEYAFNFCPNLKSITIPASVENIGYNAFLNCYGLETINVDGNNKYYTSDDGILLDKAKTIIHCYPAGKTAKEYVVPNSVKIIEGYAFWACSNLTSVIIPDNVTMIGEQAFNQSGLTSVVIPSSITSIAHGTFCNCWYLTSIVIPSTVTTIGNFVFPNCSELREIYYTGTAAQWNNIVIGSDNESLTSDNITMHYNLSLQEPSNGMNTYQVFDLGNITWDAAVAYCESLGGHMATITSQEENDYVYQLITSQGYKSAYFGLTDENEEGSWFWVDGDMSIYRNWHLGEPNTENSNEDYAMFYYKYSDGTWNDGNFGKGTVNGGTCFICEWENENLNIPEKSDFLLAQTVGFISSNPDYYLTSDTDVELTMAKKAALTDPSVTDYLWWKNILGQDDSDYHAELAIEAIVAELVVSDEVVEGVEAAAEQAAEQAMNDTLLMFAESTELFGIEGDEMEELLDLVKAIEGGAEGVEFAAERSAWLSNFFKYADLTTLTAQLEAMSKNIELVGILYEAVIGVATAPEEVYNLYISSYAYHAANESFKDSLKLFNDYVQAEAAANTGEDDYGQRVRYVAQQFENCYQRLIDTSDEKYTHYFEVVCSEAIGNAVMDLTYEATTQLIIGCVTLACPQLGAALETLKLTLEIGMNVWEAISEVDERALERDMFLNMLIFSDAIGNAMNNTEKGFPSVVLADMDEHAIKMYQCGIKFYQKINNMMLEHAQMYLIMLRDEYVWDFLGDMLDLYVGIYGEERVYEKYGMKYEDIDLPADEWIIFDMAEEYTNEFMNLIPKLESKQNQIKVHPLSAANIVQAGIYAVYAIHCPVDVAITNNGTVVAEVTNDVITTLDETSGISIHLIRTAENASASKFVMLPEGYELQILGNSTGTMSFEKAIIENGNVTTISTITDIPVQNGSVYTEVIEDGVTIALEYDQENDGVTDRTLTADITNVVTPGDLNSDDKIDASDAAMILVAAAAVGTGADSGLTTIQENAADVNGDGAFNAVDAAIVLQYAAAVGSGYTGTLEEFLKA